MVESGKYNDDTEDVDNNDILGNPTKLDISKYLKNVKQYLEGF